MGIEAWCSFTRKGFPTHTSLKRESGSARERESLTHPSAASLGIPAHFRQVQNEVVENRFLFNFYPELCHRLS